MNILFLVSAVAAVAAGCGKHGYEMEKNNNSEALAESSSLRYEQIRSKLESVLPFWDEGINTLPGNISKEPYIEKWNDFLNYVTDNNYAFEKMVGEKEVYSDEFGEEQVFFDSERGYWCYMKDVPNIDIDILDTYFSNSEALNEAVNTYEQIGLPILEREVAIATGIAGAMIGSSNEIVQEPRVEAREVVFRRVINGITVEGSSMKIDYSLQGEMFYMLLEWPAFSLDEQKEVKERKDAADEIASILSSESYGMFSYGQMWSEIVYRNNIDNQQYDPVLKVSIEENGQDNTVESLNISYSLTEGLMGFEINGL
ncbi:MAG: hypothetical protein R6V85_07250 [Polyangia bacterium]